MVEILDQTIHVIKFLFVKHLRFQRSKECFHWSGVTKGSDSQ